MMVSTGTVIQSEHTDHWTRWYQDTHDILEQPCFALLCKGQYKGQPDVPKLSRVLYYVATKSMYFNALRLVTHG